MQSHPQEIRKQVDIISKNHRITFYELYRAERTKIVMERISSKPIEIIYKDTQITTITLL